MPIKRPPRPTWHGFPDWTQLVQQWGEFAVNHQKELLETAPEEATRRVEEAEYQVQHAETDVKNAREAVAEQQRTVECLQQKLAGPDQETVARQVAALKAMPFVLGTRLEANGELAVLIRVTGERNGQPADVGDFDITFAYIEESARVLYQREAKFDTGDSLDYGRLNGFCRNYYKSDDQHTFGDIEDVEFDKETVDTFVQKVHDQLVRSPEKWYRNTPVTLPPPDPAWRGFLNDEYIARAIVASYRCNLGDAGNDLEEKQHDLEYVQEELDTALSELRSARHELRCAQALLAKLSSDQPTTIMVDPNQWMDDLKKIITFPGVMGIKFMAGIPVIHVRTSIVHQGKRYDMGDYELTLKRYDGGNESSAVIIVERTRNVTNLYYHPRYRNEEPWFCFGGRGTQIKGLFDAGYYPAMVHMAINTMNEVNKDSHQSIPDRFETISMGVVWQNTIVTKDEVDGTPAEVVIATAALPKPRKAAPRKAATRRSRAA